MPYIKTAAIGFVVDVLGILLIGQVFGVGFAKASLISTGLAGLAMLALTKSQLQRKNAIPALLCLIWIALWALGATRVIQVLGSSTIPAKLLLATAFAALTPLVFSQFLNSGKTRRNRHVAGLGLGAFGLALLSFWLPSLARPELAAPDDGTDLRGSYSSKRPAEKKGLRLFHLGHSLVGRDMPAMLAQLAGPSHSYNLQLGWGTSLREHYEPDLTINGFSQENDTPQYRDAHQALASGEYDAFIMTEMVTLTDAIRYHNSPNYAAKWAAEAASQNPDMAIYLYESWHGLDQQPDWLTRLPQDLELWTGHLLWPATRAAGRPVYLIPAGQVMAQLVQTAESRPEGLAEMTSRRDLFARTPDGQLDPIHVNDLGAYLVALTHYAVIYGKNPVGLPHQLLRADGSRAVAPSAELAGYMQQTVWDVVRSMDLTGR